jgi:exopolyphosphatase
MFWNTNLMVILSLLASRSTSCFIATRSTLVRMPSRLVCRMSTTTSSTSVSDFLKSTSLSTSNAISLGNPAGDADSIVSAIALAYMDSAFGDEKTKMAPIVSISHEVLKTQRPETKRLLQLANIDLDDLMAMDYPDLPSKISVSLVDHNFLKWNNKPDWTVTAILDHHLDERKHLDTCEERNIAFDASTSSALVASTCTLMVERFPASEEFPPSLAILLLGVILLDSINLSHKAGKVTPRDEAAVQTLLNRTDWSSLNLPAEIVGDDVTKQPDLTRLFDTLQSQKFHPDFWNSLSVLQALKLDYKSFAIQPTNKVFGISSVLQTMTEFLANDDLLDAVLEQEGQSFVEDLELLGIMFFSVVDDTPQRQIILIGKDEKKLDNLVNFFTSEGSLQVQPLDKTSKNDLHMICLKQRNFKASRKQVAPILMEYFKQGEEPKSSL